MRGAAVPSSKVPRARRLHQPMPTLGRQLAMVLLLALISALLPASRLRCTDVRRSLCSGWDANATGDASEELSGLNCALEEFLLPPRAAPMLAQ